MCMIQGGGNYIAAGGTGLRSFFGCFGTGCVFGRISPAATRCTFVPVIGFIHSPCAFIAMGDRTGLPANIAASIAVIVVCMWAG